MDNTVSHIITFIAGGFSTYIVARLLEKAKRRDSRNDEKKNFAKIIKQMPDLINEMKADLLGDNSIRMFFILPNKNIPLNVKGMYFRYYENEHSNLLHKIGSLENYGFVQNVTETNTPKYRFDETFVDLILKK